MTQVIKFWAVYKHSINIERNLTEFDIYKKVAIPMSCALEAEQKCHMELQNTTPQLPTGKLIHHFMTVNLSTVNHKYAERLFFFLFPGPRT